jgi:hypothetical protein
LNTFNEANETGSNNSVDLNCEFGEHSGDNNFDHSFKIPPFSLLWNINFFAVSFDEVELFFHNFTNLLSFFNFPDYPSVPSVLLIFMQNILFVILRINKLSFEINDIENNMKDLNIKSSFNNLINYFSPSIDNKRKSLFQICFEILSLNSQLEYGNSLINKIESYNNEICETFSLLSNYPSKIIELVHTSRLKQVKSSEISLLLLRIKEMIKIDVNNYCIDLITSIGNSIAASVYFVFLNMFSVNTQNYVFQNIVYALLSKRKIPFLQNFNPCTFLVKMNFQEFFKFFSKIKSDENKNLGTNTSVGTNNLNLNDYTNFLDLYVLTDNNFVDNIDKEFLNLEDVLSLKIEKNDSFPETFNINSKIIFQRKFLSRSIDSTSDSVFLKLKTSSSNKSLTISSSNSNEFKSYDIKKSRVNYLSIYPSLKNLLYEKHLPFLFIPKVFNCHIIYFISLIYFFYCFCFYEVYNKCYLTNFECF